MMMTMTLMRLPPSLQSQSRQSVINASVKTSGLGRSEKTERNWNGRGKQSSARGSPADRNRRNRDRNRNRASSSSSVDIVSSSGSSVRMHRLLVITYPVCSRSIGLRIVAPPLRLLIPSLRLFKNRNNGNE